MKVSSPPQTPLMIWDGECHFCRRWIERWKMITKGKVDYATSQEVADRFPEIPREQFRESVVFIDQTGEVFAGAEAVCRSLQSRPSRRWLAWSYDHIPGSAAVSEFAYRIVAHNRGLSSGVTRLLWGEDVRPPTYFWARRWFLRSLGLIYLIAFVSLWVQIDGLVGSNGLLPIGELLKAAGEQAGAHAWLVLPTLSWLNSSDAFLHFLCGGGVVLSILLTIGIAPAFSLGLLFIFYLSLTVSGQTFLNFQWDILLLETGFLAIFLAPWRLCWRPANEPPISRVSVFLLKLLLFKLMLMSGVVKLTSGDDCWWNLTALDYHYWSQPLPTVFAWWADQHPEWFKHFSVAFCLVVEIIVPFLIWAPRRPRLLAAGLIIFLQICIAITGNYCFFNLLTIALCLLLIDDASLGKEPAFHEANQNRFSTLTATVVLIVTLPLNAWLIYSAFRPDSDMPQAMRFVYERVQHFGVVNGYGLFRVMTKDRREIVIEGSADGIDWLPYEFKWKPGDVKHVPGWCAPHQPRLDWQMWFAALGRPQQNPWLGRLVVRLFENRSEVRGLLAHNPFPQKPPHYIRGNFYRYRFTTSAERKETGAWWERQFVGEYFREVSIDQLGEGRQ